MKTNPDDPAFTTDTVVNANGDVQYGAPGLTKREYMATQIIIGMMIAGSNYTFDFRAEMAVKQADELIEALNEVKP